MTILLADSLPHSSQGLSLSIRGVEHLQEIWTQVRDEFAASLTVGHR
ncbi:MAG: hypothetical protein ICV77_09865 [Cyanobacteria bacterium Co-bin8]|nr:hypothetical protein [Cyanobacteria bacterium Co-bin8]